MKQLSLLISSVLLILLLCCAVYAHPGKTDSNGGHYNSSTGGYHYHHGYEAHQHTNGVCPFDFVDKTDHSSGSTQSSNSSRTSHNWSDDEYSEIQKLKINSAGRNLISSSNKIFRNIEKAQKHREQKIREFFQICLSVLLVVIFYAVILGGPSAYKAIGKIKSQKSNIFVIKFYSFVQILIVAAIVICWVSFFVSGFLS